MKKFSLIAVAILFSVTFNSCAAKKKVAQQPVQQQTIQQPQESETQRQIRELREQQELERIKREIELENLKAESEKKKLQTQIGMQESLMSGDQTLVRFCYEESLDKPGEYMAGIGVSQPRKYERDAKQEANDIAIRDIASRFMGVIKHGTEYYSQSGVTPAGKDMDESNLESMTMNLVERTINDYANQVCYKAVQDQNEKIRYYLAIHIITNKAVDAVADRLENAQVLRDKQSFKKQLLEGLDAEARKKAEEQERQLQMLKELGE